MNGKVLFFVASIVFKHLCWMQSDCGDTNCQIERDLFFRFTFGNTETKTASWKEISQKLRFQENIFAAFAVHKWHYERANLLWAELKYNRKYFSFETCSFYWICQQTVGSFICIHSNFNVYKNKKFPFELAFWLQAERLSFFSELWWLHRIMIFAFRSVR